LAETFGPFQSCPSGLLEILSKESCVSQDQLIQFFPLVLIVLAFWFLVIRPSRKRQQETSRLQASVEPGLQVMLGSGIYGTVTAVNDDTLQLEVAPGTTFKVARQAVVRVVEDSHTDEGLDIPSDNSRHVADEQ